MDYYSGGSESSFSNMEQSAPKASGFNNKFQENSSIILIVFAMIIVALIAGFIIYGVNQSDDNSGGPDTNSSLSTLSITGGTIEPTFDPKVTEYTIYLDEDIEYLEEEMVVFTCKAASSKSTVTGCDVIVDMTDKKKEEHIVKVTAEDTSVTRYYFTIMRR